MSPKMMRVAVCTLLLVAVAYGRGISDDEEDSVVEVLHDVESLEKDIDSQEQLLDEKTTSEEDDSEIGKLKKEMKTMRQDLSSVTRQLMLQEFASHEKIRSDGYSGVKQVRTHQGGVKSYHAASHVGRSFLAIHDHENNIRTVGLGEFIAVLNGVQFRTRHNDYRLRMPHRTSKEYHATEELPFPEVPHEVLYHEDGTKKDLNEQILEMRQWFVAWKESNSTHRDYTKYFKSILCYLEGAWTNADGGEIDEPFHSDRHHLDALNWFDLQEKLRFTAYSGSKNVLENLAYLPTTIMRMENQTRPVFAQWNYRILCHPTEENVPLYMFKVDDELAARMMSKRTIDQYRRSRNAHFHLSTDKKLGREFKDRSDNHNYLDVLMEQIPGKDNYQGKLKDLGFDSGVENVDGTEKNVARYHRWFRMLKADAMGDSINHRGYSDQFMFAAQTTQPKVADMGFNYCKKRNKKMTCTPRTDKWTYAIPLEIIYLTPLNKWNPHGIPYNPNKDDRDRNGDCDIHNAYRHTGPKTYAQTPKAFFNDNKETNKRDKADTSVRGCFLGADNKPHSVVSSGTRINLPYIEGVGPLRTRFPIAPIHRSGDPVFKNYEALKDILMNPHTFDFMEFIDKLSKEEGGETDPHKLRKFVLDECMSKCPKHVTVHKHHFMISEKDYQELKRYGKSHKLDVDVEQANTHTHHLEIRYDDDAKHFIYTKCGINGKYDKRCWDGHPKSLTEVKEEED